MAQIDDIDQICRDLKVTGVDREGVENFRGPLRLKARIASWGVGLKRLYMLLSAGAASSARAPCGAARLTRRNAAKGSARTRLFKHIVKILLRAPDASGRSVKKARDAGEFNLRARGWA
jgi:hypothetical protein